MIFECVLLALFLIIVAAAAWSLRGVDGKNKLAIMEWDEFGKASKRHAKMQSWSQKFRRGEAIKDARKNARKRLQERAAT